MRLHPLFVTALVGGALVMGCGESSSEPSEPNASEQQPSTPGALQISRADLPGEWPLTVPRGVLRCEGSAGAGAVYFEAPDGTLYAVNGTAKAGGSPEIDAIWKENPDIPGTRVDISPLLERGLALCE